MENYKLKSNQQPMKAESERHEKFAEQVANDLVVNFDARERKLIIERLFDIAEERKKEEIKVIEIEIEQLKQRIMWLNEF